MTSTVLRNEVACRQLVELATPYLEGTLPPHERLLVERHLATCDDCTTYLEQMRLTIRALGALPDDDIIARTKSDVIALFRKWIRDGPTRGDS